MPLKHVATKETWCVLIDLENFDCSNNPDFLKKVLWGLRNYLWIRSKGPIDQSYCVAYVQARNTHCVEALRRVCNFFGIKLVVTQGIVDDQLKRDLNVALLSNRLPDVVFLVSGDGDFVNVVQKIRSHDRRVLVIAPDGCTSQVLRQVSDGYISWQKLGVGVA